VYGQNGCTEKTVAQSNVLLGSQQGQGAQKLLRDTEGKIKHEANWELIILQWCHIPELHVTEKRNV